MQTLEPYVAITVSILAATLFMGRMQLKPLNEKSVFGLAPKN
jgi:hypothetical protein